MLYFKDFYYFNHQSYNIILVIGEINMSNQMLLNRSVHNMIFSEVKEKPLRTALFNQPVCPSICNHFSQVQKQRRDFSS